MCAASYLRGDHLCLGSGRDALPPFQANRKWTDVHTKTMDYNTNEDDGLGAHLLRVIALKSICVRTKAPISSRWALLHHCHELAEVDRAVAIRVDLLHQPRDFGGSARVL